MKDLQSAYQFDAAALKQNQAGQITEAQDELLDIYRRNGRWGVRGSMIAFIGTIAFICGAWALSDPISRNTFRDEAIAFSIIALVLIAAMIYSWITYSLQAKRLNRADVLHVEGTVSKKKERFRRTSLFIYYVRVDKVKFRVDTAQKWEVLQDGGYYRFHYIKYPPVHIILSVETLY